MIRRMSCDYMRDSNQTDLTAIFPRKVHMMSFQRKTYDEIKNKKKYESNIEDKCKRKIF